MIPAALIASRIARLAPGARVVLTGIDREGVGDALRADGGAGRGVLLLASRGLRTVDAILDQLLTDLADLALARWPYWYGLADRSVTDRSVTDLLADAAQADARIARPWLRAAAKRAGAGLPPRFGRSDRTFELGQLLRAVDPAGVALVAEFDPSDAGGAAPLIEALERCAACGAAVVAALAAVPPSMPPYDRILYGALAVVRPPVAVEDRFIAARSRAHPASPTERRVEDALARDPELDGLFAGNALVRLDGGRFTARVDLLWGAGRVVVEIDGPEHRGAAAFDADRHRDYELLVAGYRVLRLTNAQVEADLGRAVEKIRAVVRLRRSTEGDGIR